jgi:hypothetical protein
VHPEAEAVRGRQAEVLRLCIMKRKSLNNLTATVAVRLDNEKVTKLPTFVEDTSQRTGLSERTVWGDTQIATSIAPEVRDMQAPWRGQCCAPVHATLRRGCTERNVGATVALTFAEMQAPKTMSATPCRQHSPGIRGRAQRWCTRCDSAGLCVNRPATATKGHGMSQNVTKCYTKKTLVHQVRLAGLCVNRPVKAPRRPCGAPFSP